MKLVFAAGEFPPLLLQQGVKRIGSAVDADIALRDPEILPQHCELHVNPQGVMLKIARGALVTVNQRPADGLISLRVGDQIGFAGVQALIMALDAPRPPSPAPELDDVGATTVRAALPKYALRAQTGRMLGRSYPLTGASIVGRAPDCQLRLDDSNLSRKHAKLIPTNEGVVIEDLGSTNGSFHNGKRVQRAVAQPGDEIGFDTLRFLLLELGAESARSDSGDAMRTSSPPRWIWVVLALIAIAIAVFLIR
ncbi:MAG: FHA domain-containing protein [Xanthomonadales bacterium]|nr:FHA domain-containing protein [Xanthomonadales bacterium]